MGNESDRVKAALQKMLDGMILKDIPSLKESLSENMVLVHMTGHRQNRDEFLAEIMDGTLNYRSNKMVDSTIEIDGETASVILKTETDAAVYGGGYHHWRLVMRTKLQLIDNDWKVTYSEVGTW